MARFVLRLAVQEGFRALFRSTFRCLAGHRHERGARASGSSQVMKGVLLGTGGWIPTTRRETCCAFFRAGTHVLLIDAGTGVQRLVERPDLLEGVGKV